MIAMLVSFKMPAKTYQYSGKFEWELKTKLNTKNGYPISGQDRLLIKPLIKKHEKTISTVLHYNMFI